MNFLSHIPRASPLAGLALAFLLLVSFPALAQKSERTRVIDSILGVGIGTSLDQVHAKLDPLSTRESRDSHKEAEDRKAGRKQAWTLNATDFATIAVKTNGQGRVVWITGFVRPGKDIPFANLGNLSSAASLTDTRAIWSVATPGGGYRLVAKGQNGKARVISLLSLATPTWK